MFKSKDRKDTPNITNTVIGNGITFQDNLLKGYGSIRIDGTIFSDISIEGDIIVGETGCINGNLTVSNALIAGKIEGNVTSINSVHLSSTAKLSGNITSSSLVIDEGAIFSGSCVMSKQEPMEIPNLVYKVQTESTSELDSNLSFDKN